MNAPANPLYIVTGISNCWYPECNNCLIIDVKSFLVDTFVSKRGFMLSNMSAINRVDITPQVRQNPE